VLCIVLGVEPLVVDRFSSKLDHLKGILKGYYEIQGGLVRLRGSKKRSDLLCTSY
jgi:hypothetical protein